MSSAVIFIEPPGGNREDDNKPADWRRLYYVSVGDLCFRIFASFIPPFALPYRKVYVDFLGPLLAVVSLIFILNYGHFLKSYKAGIKPNEFLFLYVLVMPMLCYSFAKIGSSDLKLIEIMALLGYGLYGHIFTLLTSYICFQETNDTFFFIALIAFNAPSTFRLLLILLKTIPSPAPRLIICSIVGILHILSLICIHFVYMHPHFIYGKNN